MLRLQPPGPRSAAERDSLARSGGGVWGVRHSTPQNERLGAERDYEAPSDKPLRFTSLTLGVHSRVAVRVSGMPETEPLAGAFPTP